MGYGMNAERSTYSAKILLKINIKKMEYSWFMTSLLSSFFMSSFFFWTWAERCAHKDGLFLSGYRYKMCIKINWCKCETNRILLALCVNETQKKTVRNPLSFSQLGNCWWNTEIIEYLSKMYNKFWLELYWLQHIKTLN